MKKLLVLLLLLLLVSGCVYMPTKVTAKISRIEATRVEGLLKVKFLFVKGKPLVESKFPQLTEPFSFFATFTKKDLGNLEVGDEVTLLCYYQTSGFVARHNIDNRCFFKEDF